MAGYFTTVEDSGLLPLTLISGVAGFGPWPELGHNGCY
jgi:hypothetical protein